MGIFDKAKDFAQENADKVSDAVDKAADFADEKTGGKYSDKIDKASDFVKDQADKAGGEKKA
ncbi:hypothetical protein GCM10011519_31630 [Marmoricola endophyticus]|uniref:Antitoxin n=1 Tax=Marmoricola endophyticus TaxID=2040280 RepID=A0A917F6C6_9ACTN|nr:antitoxin [Marmoricola endophyticus]GGF55427.1 hypothetical protein GCM10011519_31630 [Marmoricola endophyticus]